MEDLLGLGRVHREETGVKRKKNDDGGKVETAGTAKGPKERKLLKKHGGKDFREIEKKKIFSFLTDTIFSEKLQQNKFLKEKILTD